MSQSQTHHHRHHNNKSGIHPDGDGGRGLAGQANVVVAGIPSTDSSQHLIVDSDSIATGSSVAGGPNGGSTQSMRQYGDGRTSAVTAGEWFAVAVLCFVNLINYMDRFTIAGE